MIVPSIEAAKEIIEQKLMSPVNHWSICIIDKRKLRVYKSLTDKAEDLYFLGAYKYDSVTNDYEWFNNKMTIYKLDKQYLVNFRQHMIGEIPEKNLIVYPPGLATMVWQAGIGLIKSSVNSLQQSGDIGIDANGAPYRIPVPGDSDKELSIRDQACLALRVPESNLEWLNTLILKSRELDFDTQKRQVDYATEKRRK